MTEKSPHITVAHSTAVLGVAVVMGVTGSVAASSIFLGALTGVGILVAGHMLLRIPGVLYLIDTAALRMTGVKK